MLSTVDCYVIARESNVVRVDFSRDPDPPAPCFPGANGLRLSDAERDDSDAPMVIAIRAVGHDRASRFQSATEGVTKSKNSAGHLELRTRLPNYVRG
jgi:hypothetical protein